MARNKYPERTVAKILDVSYRLFTEKGYEKTTIQDIVRQLGMSKGAIYHHFKSKEEILDALSERVFQKRFEQNPRFPVHESCDGLEKIRRMIKSIFANPEKAELDKMRSAMFQIPLTASDIMRNNVHDNAPEMARMIEEANADGSASVSDPQMCAEILFTLINLWASPFINNNGMDMFLRRAKATGIVLEHLGLPILDEEMMELLKEYYRKIETVL